MTRSLATAVVLVVSAAGLARAEDREAADGLTTPEPGHPNRRGMPRATPRRDSPPPDEDEAGPWPGPRVELGYTHYAIVDGFGGGDVHSGVFGGYLPTGSIRLHAAAELGVRDYSIGQDDAVVRGHVLAGYQRLVGRRFLPYGAVVGTLGALIGKRFHTPLTHALFGAGLEVGADLLLVRSLFVGMGLSWVRASIRGLGYDLYAIRLRIGL